MTHNKLTTTSAVVIGATLALLASAAPASARPEPQPGPHAPRDSSVRVLPSLVSAIDEYRNCPVRRVGDQLVRCDNLIGGHAHRAPAWVKVYGTD